MPDDFDHEVIDSPEALLRHLHEVHGVTEVLELDPAAVPLQFWLRKHAELERAAHRHSGPPPAPPPAPAPAPTRTGARAPAAPAAAPSGPRFRPFADPLVEAAAAALVRRGLDERQVRRGLSTYGSADGRHGEEAVRATFIAPLLDALAAQLAGERTGQVPRPRPDPLEQQGPQGPQGPPARRPHPPAPEPDADFMAIADVLQRRRQSRQGARQGARPDAAPSPPPAPATPATPAAPAAHAAPRDPDDDYMALADALQQRRAGQGRR